MDNDLRNRFRAPTTSRQTTIPPRPQRPPTSTVQPPRSMPTTSAPQAPVPPQTFTPPPAKKKKSRKKLIIIISIILLALILAAGGAYAYRHQKRKSDAFRLGNGQKTDAPDEDTPNGMYGIENQQTGTVRLVATGDMIAHDSVNANAKQADGSYDYLPFMKDMKPYFEKADIRFCNQATPAGGEQFGITGYPVFNAPIAFARGIEGVGCNVVNIGTNHTNDKGQPLVDATAAAWDGREGILAVAGANRTVSEQNQIDIFTVKGIKVAFLSYTTYSNNMSLTPYGINMYSDTLATAQVAEAQKNADIVLVSMRWGTEYSPDINAQQDAIAQKLTDLGADIIVGHGPHVLEPVKLVKSSDGSSESIVWYSLGNFLNTQIETEALVGGFAIMDIDIPTKKIANVAFMPTYMHYDWSAADKRGNNLLARKNLTMVPLDKAADLLAKSQLGTTVEAQTARVTDVLNKYTAVKIIPSTEY